MSISQKDGVYNAVTAFLSENGIAFEDYQADPLKLATEQRRVVVGMLVEATQAGELTVKGKTKSYDTEAALREYYNGTLGNWLSKDPRFNGNIKHTIKAPGSRAGQGDAMLKNLKNLMKQVSVSGSEEQIAQVQSEIDKRQGEIASERAAKVEINPDLIPDDLKHLIS